MFLVLDVEMVEDFALFGFCEVGVAVLRVELLLPHVNLCVLLLHKLDKVLVFIHKVGVLSKQKLDLFLQIIDFFALPNLEQQFFVDCHKFSLQLTGA